MKWNVAGALALLCVLSMVGCHNEIEKPVAPQRVTVDTSSGKVMLQDVIEEVAGKSVTAAVVGNGVDATFRLVSTGDGVNVMGGRAELLDPWGHLLFAIETTMNKSTGEITMTQATANDYLTFSISGDNDDRVQERYDANGDVAVFDYPALADDAQRHAVNYYEHGLPASRLPGNVSEYVFNLAAFDAYYEPHANSTLHDNPYGAMLVQIVTSPDAAALVVTGETDPHVLRWIQNACNTARACYALICRTNPGSLACSACTAVSIACSIFDFICGWVGCS